MNCPEAASARCVCLRLAHDGEQNVRGNVPKTVASVHRVVCRWCCTKRNVGAFLNQNAGTEFAYPTSLDSEGTYIWHLRLNAPYTGIMVRTVVVKFSLSPGSIRLKIAPWTEPTSLVTAVFNDAAITSVNEYAEEQLIDLDLPWDIIGFDSR